MKEIVLGDNEIEQLINGEPIQRTLSDGETVLIRQSYVKGMGAPIINRDKRVFSSTEIESIKRSSSIMADAFKIGY